MLPSSSVEFCSSAVSRSVGEGESCVSWGSAPQPGHKGEQNEVTNPAVIPSSHHISQPPSGSPAPLVGLFARAQLYTHEEVSGTVILADPLPALDYRLDLSLHLRIIRSAQHGTEGAGASLSTASPTDFPTPLPRTASETIVCSPHCFVRRLIQCW